MPSIEQANAYQIQRMDGALATATLSEGDETFISFLYWINDGSHTIPDDLYVDSYTDSVERYRQIFKKVFVNMGHEAHYKMMMGEQ